MNKSSIKFFTNFIPDKEHRKLARRLLMQTLQTIPKKIEPLSKPYIPPKNTYKKLITTCGFIHSGSGTIIDLLSEFDNTTVLAYHDPNGGSPLSKDRNTPQLEINFVSKYGGVMDLEHAFSDYTRNSEVKLVEFIHFAEYNYKNLNYSMYNDEYMRLTRKFIDNLVSYRYPFYYPMDGNDPFAQYVNCDKDYSNLESPMLYNQNEHKRYMYKLKHLSIEEYRKYAKEYIQSFLNTIESKENLVLDYLFSEHTFDAKKYKDYVGDFKQIIVWRDPRDVYMTNLINGPWVTGGVEDFVNWFKKEEIDRAIQTKNDCMLTLRFEDVVLNYDKTIPKVLDFLEIDKSHHIYPKTQFRPEYSKRNIGLYKNYEKQDEIKYIENHLKKYLWEN